ncbi:MAG: fibro-slime domain-containing protein [Phycisphaerales bacterium]
MTRKSVLSIAAIVAATGGIAPFASAGFSYSNDNNDGTSDPTSGVQSMRLTGVIRDFQVSHPDFETYAGSAPKNMVLNDLGDDGKPVLNVDLAASRGWGKPASVTSEESFNQWWRDVPGVNVSIPYTIELKREERPEGAVYAFAKEKPEYFFPIDNQGYGLSMEGLRWAPPGKHNFHFTYELETTFVYTDPAERDAPLVFSFTGDDDVFVFINGKLAIDLGGVHSQLHASVNLDEKAEYLGIEPGEEYQLKLFFAERHTSESNFRIETNLVLRPAKLPVISALAD